MSLTPDAIKQQSLSAYNQWAVQWRAQAKEHYREKHNNLKDFQNHGIGKACLLVGNGYSFEENIETIKKHQDNVDIVACDKSMGGLLDNGITPDFVLLCDANVSYEKYMKPYEDKLKDTILFSNVCANPDWTRGGKWKDKYFFVNEDVLKSEVEFSKISNCYNFIPAATNVTGAMSVFMTQSNNNGRNNFFGYDKILMIGFDYCWRPDGGYYAFDHEGGGKRNYMKHVGAISYDGQYIQTSNNLLFSAKWLDKYIRTFSLPFVQCGKGCLLSGAVKGDLEKHIQYSYRAEDREEIRSAMSELSKLDLLRNKLNNKIQEIGRDHYNNMRATL